MSSIPTCSLFILQVQVLPTLPSKYIPHQSASPRFHRSSLQSRHGHPWSIKIPILLPDLPAYPHTDSLSSSCNGLFKPDRIVTHPQLQFKACLGLLKGASSPKRSGPHYFSSITLLPSSLSIFQLHHFLSAPQITELLSASVHWHLLFISAGNILLQNAQLSSPIQLSSKVTPSSYL